MDDGTPKRATIITNLGGIAPSRGFRLAMKMGSLGRQGQWGRGRGKPYEEIRAPWLFEDVLQMFLLTRKHLSTGSLTLSPNMSFYNALPFVWGGTCYLCIVGCVEEGKAWMGFGDRTVPLGESEGEVTGVSEAGDPPRPFSTW